MELNEQLKELSFQMMLNEMAKMQIENSHHFDRANGITTHNYSTQQGYHYGIMQADKKGYELSLAFNELLFQNGQKYNVFNNGPDAVNISAENLLYKYGLSYPISWYVASQDRDGLHFGYYDSKRIDDNHLGFLNQVNELLASGKIDKNTSERLIAAGEYYSNHHKLLSKYFNHEDLEKSQIL